MKQLMKAVLLICISSSGHCKPRFLLSPQVFIKFTSWSPSLFSGRKPPWKHAGCYLWPLQISHCDVKLLGLLNSENFLTYTYEVLISMYIQIYIMNCCTRLKSVYAEYLWVKGRKRWGTREKKDTKHQTLCEALSFPFLINKHMEIRPNTQLLNIWNT